MSEPMAYLITWRTYGTWLRGDARGSVDRAHQAYDSPLIEPQPAWERFTIGAHLHEAPFRISAVMVPAIERAIVDTSMRRGWSLEAANVRSNHVHVVVSAHVTPERVLTAFKANATQALRAMNLIPPERTRLWVRHGSTRYLWTEENRAAAIDYVVNRQGSPLRNRDR